MNQEPDMVFTSKPNMNYIMQVMCDLLSRQDGGKYEYSYTLTEKDDSEISNIGEHSAV